MKNRIVHPVFLGIIFKKKTAMSLLYAYFYKSLPILHGIIHILEFICTFSLLIKMIIDPNFFFPDNDDTASGQNLNTSSTETEIFTIIVGGSFFFSAFIPFITVFCLLFILSINVSMFYLFLCFECFRRCNKALFCSKASHRFISLNCNCPCYQARPQLRFGFRFIFLLICLCLRIFVIIGCLILSRSIMKKLAIICGISCIFLIFQFLLDYYHYRVVWHYIPDGDNQERKSLSVKHQRYLPYHLLGHNRSNKIGNKPCKNKTNCKDRQLEHIMIFHANDYQPQLRWSEVKKYTTVNTYIGFHQTTPESAIQIAHSDFLPSLKPPQMLGFGIYFARSLENTFGKARNNGAFICAEIRMGNVKEVVVSQLEEVRNSDQWWNEYDTVYYNHQDETRDEFCIKNSSQIIRWIMTIDEKFDKKIHNYGMYTEFDDTKCGCC